MVDQLVDDIGSSDLNSNVTLLDEMVSFISAPAEEVREKTLVFTSGDLEAEYSVHRDSIINDVDVQQEIQVNEGISGFCNAPESVVHLDVHEDFVKHGYRKQYPVPQAAHEAVTAQIDKWLAAGK